MRPFTNDVITPWYRPPEISLGCDVYGHTVDIWSVGCIIAEISNNVPLFCGNTLLDQLHQIFQLLGTPFCIEDSVHLNIHKETLFWPQLSSFPYWRNNFPKWYPRCWENILPRLSKSGCDLVSNMLAYNPLRRISAIDAKCHQFFHSNDDHVINISKIKMQSASVTPQEEIRTSNILTDNKLIAVPLQQVIEDNIKPSKILENTNNRIRNISSIYSGEERSAFHIVRNPSNAKEQKNDPSTDIRDGSSQTKTSKRLKKQ